jgi:hypothetical protein
MSHRNVTNPKRIKQVEKTKILKKKWLVFILVFISSIGITFLPVLIFRDKTVFDPVRFVNEWINLFGGGIIMALMFYAVTQIISSIDNKNEDEKYINEIIYILRQIKSVFKNKEVEKKKDAVDKLKMILLNIDMMNCKKVKLLLYKEFIINNSDIESELNHLDAQTEDTRQIESKIQDIIQNIELWKTKLSL